MKRMLKTISIGLVIALLLSVMSLSVFAAGEQTTVTNCVLNGTMSETTNGWLTYWTPILGAGANDSTIAQRSSNLSYGGVTIRPTNGAFAMMHPSVTPPAAYEAAIEELIILVPNGTYNLSASIFSTTTDADKEAGAYAKMYAYSNDGNTAQTLDIPHTGAAWSTLTLSGITVTNGKVRVGFGVKSLGTTTTTARGLYIDNVALTLASSVINGTVTGAGGGALSGVSIDISKDGNTVASAVTGADGKYGNLTVPAGSGYVLTASKTGYRTITKEVSFTEGATAAFDLQFSAMMADNAYFFDAENGDDLNDGRTPETAWQTVDKFNATTFQPGDNILFKAGSVWTNVGLVPKGSGTADAPIVVGKYGDADRYPMFNANYLPGTPLSDMVSTQKRLNTLNIDGVSYWEFCDLELTNFSFYNADMNHDSQKSRRAVTITSRGGTMRGITLNGLYIHDVNGWNPKANADNGAGIQFQANGQTRIDGLTIENCVLKDITRDGITGSGYTGTRPWGWNSWDGQSGTPIRHRNVVIRNNVLDTIAGDGIVITGTIGAVVEYNLGNKICNNPRKYPGMSGNQSSNLSAGFWPFDADNTVFQYNEVRYTGAPRGTEVADGEAFDSDYYCVNTTFQYNYSHDNEGGFLMICGPAYAYTDGTVARYNISENDGSMYGKRTIFQIGGGGGVNNSTIYNNTIYTGEGHAVFSIMNGEPWDGKPQGTKFYNNIFDINGMVGQFGFAGDKRDAGKAGIATYSHNLYTGSFFDTLPKDMPADDSPVYGDPKFGAPGQAGDGYENARAYKIRKGSAAIGAGLEIDQSWLGQKLNQQSYVAGNRTTAANKAVYFKVDGAEFQWQNYNGGKDFFGNAIPAGSAPDIGAHQYTGTADPANRYTVSTGEMVSVPIVVKNCNGFSGMQGPIVYDKSLLTLDGLTASKGFSLVSKGDYFVVATPQGAGALGDVVVGYALFTAKADLPDDVTILVSFPEEGQIAYDKQLQPIIVDVPDINVRILGVPPMLGDVNLSGTLDVADAILLMQYLAGSADLTPKQLKAADANGDGKVNVGDVTIIMQMCLPA